MRWRHYSWGGFDAWKLFFCAFMGLIFYVSIISNFWVSFLLNFIKKTFLDSLQNSVNEILIKLWGSQWVVVLPPSSFTIVIVWCHNEVVFWFLPQQNILIMTKYFHHHLPTLHAFYFLEIFFFLFPIWYVCYITF